MKIFGRIMAIIGSLLLMILLFLVGVILILEYGPSKTARNLFVTSAMETSAGKFMATLFIPKKTIKEIQKANSVEDVTDITDSTLIDINNETVDKDRIDITEINESTYHGYLATIYDPSRVMVGISGEYGPSHKGKQVVEMAKKYNATLATNAGGFSDYNGTGNGGIPKGVVISEGKIRYSAGSEYPLIGIDKNNKLVVGKMSAKKAIDMGVRDAVSFGPILIVNGKPSKVNGTGGGLNPRTVIGQRKDGAILLLVTEGRQANSLGATMLDVQNLMIKLGAENAANLDGGSSSLMYYKGEYINDCASLIGPRDMPTAIIVK